MPGPVIPPMTYQQAFGWLTSGESYAGTLVTSTRANSLLSWARDAGVVHLTRGRDLKAPGYLLTWDGDRYAVYPVPPRHTTPGAVGDTLRAFGFELAGRNSPGWVTNWAGPAAVRVQNKAAGRAQIPLVKQQLERSGWVVETMIETPGAWLRVTQQQEPEDIR